MQLLEEKGKKMKNIIGLAGFYNPCGFIVILLLFLPALLSGKPLSENAKIMILTCGPEKPMYAMFGHTAIRVDDPQNHIDEVYNFGTFDSGTPNFYIKFLGGRLQYALSVNNYQSFIREYKNEKRWVKGQELLLSKQFKEILYDSLREAYRPENRYYRYDFFRDNCSSKIINLVTSFTENQSAIDSLNTSANLTYRSALRYYLQNRPWMLFGFNLLLGPFSDQEISRKQSAFLPDYLMLEIEKTGLASGPELLLEGNDQAKRPGDIASPMMLLWIIALIFVVEVFWLKTSKSVSNGIDLFLFTLSAVLGLLFLILWFWSDHVSLHVNLNLLWANPLLLILLWTIPAEKKRFNRIFLLLYALLLFFFLINFNKLPQKIPMELMPIVTVLALRAVNRVFQFRKMESKIE